MKYGVRITKDIASGKVTVHRVVPVRDSARGYRLNYPEAGTAESLQVFDTKAEADEAVMYEKYAADYAEKSVEELMEIVQKSIAMYKSVGIPFSGACKLMGLPYDAIRAYLGDAYTPNPRVVARLHLSTMVLHQAMEKMKTILPDLGICGRQSSGRRQKEDEG